MTTAPVQGQPAAAFPVASPSGRIGPLAVLAAVVAVGPVPVRGGSLLLSAVAGVTSLLADVDTGGTLRRGELALRSAETSGPGAMHRNDDAPRVTELPGVPA